ncbi:hypothetical protein [Actinoplanes sp. M2I2]|uniref:hypothetical protein n=1 Tax=Actinoplanes sp. M2I2 TaxID=1734444 RepID=UPI002021F088|nr:hypothetical protein [Actinoplanes sp. M2I2]
MAVLLIGGDADTGIDTIALHHYRAAGHVQRRSPYRLQLSGQGRPLDCPMAGGWVLGQRCN